MKRFFILFINLFFFPALVFSNLPNDTLIYLEGVSIEASRQKDLTTGNIIHNIDSARLKSMHGQHLAYLLSRHSSMFIKSYGPGVLATTALRGGSASHTALLWNGFSLENPMNQQNDLALLPVFFMEEVSVQHGGNSALWGSGAVGGAIYLNNSLTWGNGIEVSGGFTASSIECLGQNLNIKYGTESFKSSLKIFNHNSRNRYKYHNLLLPDNPSEIQQHAGIDQWGLMQENYLQSGKHSLNLRLWLQDNSRNIPPALMQPYNQAYQHDRSFRVTSQWQVAFSNVVSNLRSGYFREHLLYYDNFNLESPSNFNILTNEAEIRWRASQKLLLYSGASLRLVKASAREYDQNRYQNTFAVFSSLAWEPLELFKATLSLRQELTNEMVVPLVPALAFSWKASQELSLITNLARNYRIPSLNDRYWIPGGNPDLEPESGWSQDVSMIWRSKKTIVENISSTIFHRRITNWIIWLPMEGGSLWTPRNIMSVRSYGSEFRMKGTQQVNPLLIEWELQWDHVISKNDRTKGPNDQSIGKQLIYVPKNRAGLLVDLSWKKFSISYNHQFTSRRYTSSDNSSWLQPYNTADLGLFWKSELMGKPMSVFFSAINIWNQDYFAMVSRPMPLRHFIAGLNLNFTSNKH
jgi:vitamin B12 transporter